MIELQKLDCNCNNCKFLERDFKRQNQAKEQHKNWQLNYFNTLKNKAIEAAQEQERKYQRAKNQSEDEKAKAHQKKAKLLFSTAKKMRFQFDKSTCSILYGCCKLKKKSISFIPNILLFETQLCFLHRKL